MTALIFNLSKLTEKEQIAMAKVLKRVEVPSTLEAEYKKLEQLFCNTNDENLKDLIFDQMTVINIALFGD